jgi:signal transduction histidine kinase
MDATQDISRQLDSLATRLEGRREAVLENWRRAIEADTRLTSISTIARAQFYDHIPGVLDAFVRALRAKGAVAQARADAGQRHSAGEHGLVRWQQGFGLFEVMLEWRHLHLCLLDEFERDCAEHVELEGAAMLFARRALAELCSDGVCESADQYVRLQQVDAAGRADDLEQALARLNELEKARSEVWREAAHDLRGNLGVVRNATELLNLPEVPESTRVKSLEILHRSVDSLHSLLGDMTSLARLEAGREVRQVQEFDAATLLQQLAEDFRPMAAQRGLFLHAEGPPSLPVRGDSAKVRRIAQNLLLNALQYTERGGVKLHWGEDIAERWFFSVQDSGPGLRERSAPLAHAIRQATEEAKEAVLAAVGADELAPAKLETGAVPAPAAPLPESMPESMPSQSRARSGRPAGEGLGLSIVKRLCELLDASIELQTAPGRGSTFRISLPRSYPA